MLSLFRYKTKTRIRGIIECFFFIIFCFLLVCLFFFLDQRMVSMMKFVVVIGERGACTDESRQITHGG